jgi:hypothetical protein
MAGLRNEPAPSLFVITGPQRPASRECGEQPTLRVPVIPVQLARPCLPKRDGRDKPGHDDG